MNAQKQHAPPIGSAFDLRRITSAIDCGPWICFAHSDSNHAILRLAPASNRPLTSDAVRIRSADNAILWMIPGVEIAVHSLDLRDLATGDTFEISAEDGDGPLRDDVDDANEDEAMRGRLTDLAMAIETQFHEPAEPVLPNIDECRIESVSRVEPSANFSWTPDLQRTYTLSREGAQWKLRQRYNDASAMPSDALVPLRTRGEVITFSPSEDGSGSGMVADAESLQGALGLHYSRNTNELRRGSAGDQIQIAAAIHGRLFTAGAFRAPPLRPGRLEPTHAVLLRLAANDSQFRRAANFATGDASPAPGERTVKFSWNDDVVELIARPDPTGRRVQLEVRIEAPRSARPGARLELNFPGTQAEPAGVVLAAMNDHLHGAASVAISWTEFSEREEALIEVLGANPAE